MVVLFTGMSGIGIKKSLKKFKAEFKEFRTKYPERKPEIIEFETEIENVYYEKNSKVKRSKQIWKDHILTLPYSVLEDYWKLAFKKVHKKIKEISNEDANKYIFVNLHACYFHNRTQEYLSLISIQELKKLKVDKVITYIDDIYEIHHRLTELGGIFHDDKQPTKTEVILRHIRLLDWRAKEAMMSRFLAKQLNCEHYVFAIKHSFDTLSNLIYEDFLSAYLSHPITEVRRLEKRKETEQADAIRNEITQISEFLSLKFTAFLPTTIDEYRIDFDTKKAATNGETVEVKTYYPVLRNRWEEDIYKKPSNYLYVHSGFTNLNDLWKQNRPRKKDEALSYLLTVLADIVSDQVTVRDYSLVEQSEVIVLYRPLFNGNASGGVLEEFNYFLTLKMVGTKAPFCFMYCPPEDIDKFYCKELKLKIDDELKEQKGLKHLGSKKFSGLTVEEEKKLIAAKRDKNLIKDLIDEVFDRCKITINVSNTRTPLSQDKLKKFKTDFVDELLQTFTIVDDYRSSDNTDLFVDKSSSVSEFFEQITLFLTTNSN